MTGVTTVVSLTLLRARQGERLAFALAYALAKRVVVTSVTTVMSFCEQGGELLAFAFANALAKWDMVSALCPVSLKTQTRQAPLALLAGASNSPQWSH